MGFPEVSVCFSVAIPMKLVKITLEKKSEISAGEISATFFPQASSDFMVQKLMRPPKHCSSFPLVVWMSFKLVKFRQQISFVVFLPREC